MPQRLQREVFVFQRNVVLELLERENRAALAPQVGHLQASPRPNALHLNEIAVLQTPHDLGFDVTLDLREGMVIFPDPHDRFGVLRNLFLRRRRLNLPAWRTIDRFLSEEAIVVLVYVPFFEILEAEIGAEESRGPIL